MSGQRPLILRRNLGSRLNSAPFLGGTVFPPPVIATVFMVAAVRFGGSGLSVLGYLSVAGALTAISLVGFCAQVEIDGPLVSVLLFGRTLRVVDLSASGEVYESFPSAGAASKGIYVFHAVTLERGYPVVIEKLCIFPSHCLGARLRRQWIAAFNEAKEAGFAPQQSS